MKKYSNNNNDVKRTTVYLPDKLLKKAKISAIQEGKTLTILLREGLELILSKKRGKS